MEENENLKKNASTFSGISDKEIANEHSSTIDIESNTTEVKENKDITEEVISEKRNPQKHEHNEYFSLVDVLTKMVENAYSVLGNHFEKLKTLRQKCHDTDYDETESSTASSNKLPDETSRIEDVDALKDKIEELMLQKEEFQQFLRICIDRIKATCSNVTYSCYSKILREFEIECTRLQDSLPIYARRSEIVYLVQKKQVSIILGETGSGKSTQIVQYVNQANVGPGIVACTQPRKVAALSLAARVASELQETVGHTVAYQVGMKSNRGRKTKILFMTDQILLYEMLKDRLLQSFSTIIIDEAHERSIYTDLLLGMIKSILPQRQDLRVVITSATMDPQVFVRYFGDSPVIKVSGRMFPVEVHWSENESLELDNYEQKAVAKVLEVHNSELPGDILVFLTSQQEIERCAKRIEEALGKHHNALVFELHGKLQADEQQRIFCETPIDKRKIVLSTNVAETSVTIKGIKYVIDTGVAKEMRFDSKTKISSLDVTPITQSSAEQRKGRAGRTSSGKCFRLYSAEDYETMRKSSPPEILRVDLGHAILKLLQLGVDPLSFDFVEPPSEDAMKSAYAGLEQIKAVSEKCVTDKGMWLSKLPLSPVLGSLVFEAVQLGIGRDGIVLAACCSKGSSLFYRAGSEKEKADADKAKFKFFHHTGDHLTFFKAYKEWDSVAEKEKGKWCKEHFINGKVAKSIRDTVQEIHFAVKKELHIRIENTANDEEARNILLQNLLFITFMSNLCYFLGHSKAGYFLIEHEKRVAIHPSSAILTVDVVPQWIIIEQILNTTREYAVNVTAVGEADIESAIKSGELKVDQSSLQRIKMEEVHSEHLGSLSLKQCRGPRRIIFREIEEKHNCIIEEDFDKKQISIFASRENAKSVSSLIRDQINDCQIKLQKQRAEVPLLVTAPDVRAILGAGGILETILYPKEFLTVNVYTRNRDSFDTDIKFVQFFQVYGDIAEWRLHRWSKIPYYIGQITFRDKTAAQRAVEMFNSSDGTWLAPNIKSNPRSSEKLEVHISWCRRPLQGVAFIQLKDSVMTQKALCHRNITVNGVQSRLTKSKKDDGFICINKLPQSADEKTVIDSIKFLIHCSDSDFERVTVPRTKIDADPEALQRAETSLISQLVQYVPRESFRIRFKEPKASDFKYEAFVTFLDHKTGSETINKMTNIYINGQHVSFRQRIYTSLNVPSNVFSKVEELLRKFIEVKVRDTELKLRQRKNNDWSIEIKSTDAEQLMNKRNGILNIIKGEIVESESEAGKQFLFSELGRDYLQSVMQESDTEVILKDRNRNVLVYGCPEKRENALCLIYKKLKEFENRTHLLFELKGKERHPGLLKAVMKYYGSDFGSLKSEFQLDLINFDYKRRCLFMIGESENVHRCEERLKDIELSLRGRSDPASDLPECSICFCEIQLEELYRLESCGHSYCTDCVKFQIESSIMSNELPLQCAVEACCKLWSWQDIDFMIGKGAATRSSLATSSVSSFVMKNKDTFSYCITPDCPIVYKTTETGENFHCPACNTDICSKCRVEYHFGLPCLHYQDLDDPESSINAVMAWMKENPSQRKLCPKCGTGIEKNGGCNRMICYSCKCIMCWVCSEIFETERMCYGHLDSKHSDIY